jgi:peptide chain release factor 2
MSRAASAEMSRFDGEVLAAERRTAQAVPTGLSQTVRPSHVRSGDTLDRVDSDVVHPDDSADLKALEITLTSIETALDVNAMKAQIDELSTKASAPDLWSDLENAQKITSALSHTQAELKRILELRQRLDDLAVLYELGDDYPETLDEAKAEARALHGDIEALEVRTLLSGEYDIRDALVTIRSEAGGVDAADFAEMLQRMYLRWAERHNYPTEVFETSYAEEAGIKSTTFEVKAPYAYGTLSVEQGTHRLVRISPFDNQGRRQTSFAGVEVLPVVASSDAVEIDEKELRIDVYRSSGPGGQGVNTTDSAVRITHLPTGIVVSCQNERSQLQNRASAMTVLQSKLLERRRQEEKATMDALKDGGNSWGNQMRSYVLHPYQMVKDLRTNFEVGNPSAVFDGDIDGFVEAGIRWRRSNEQSQN